MRLLALPRRVWKSLHPFTWLVMLVVGAGLVIIVVPAEGQSVWDMEIEEETHWAYAGVMSGDDVRDYNVDIFLHGWPRPAIARAIYTRWTRSHSGRVPFPPPPTTGSAKVIPYWTRVESWPFSGDQWVVSWQNLAINMLAISVGLVGVSAATEIWLRFRGGLWRFRILDLLVLLTIGCVIASWYQSHRRLWLAEEQVTAYIAMGSTGLSPVDRNGIVQPRPKYGGPLWLQRLVGHDDYLTHLCHAHRVELEVTKNLRQDLEQLVRLAHVEEVEIVGVIPKVIIERLGRLPRLKTLELVANKHWVSSHSQEYWDTFPDSERLQPWQFDQLRVLPLIELSIESLDLLAEDIECVARSMPHLESLFLQHVPTNSREIEGLKAKYPFVVYFEDFNSSAETARRRDDLKRQRAERLKEETSAR